MVELNNKLILPIYSRFEHKFLNDFIVNSQISCQANFGDICENRQFNSTLDRNVEQIKNHLNKIQSTRQIVISDSYAQNVEINLQANSNFASHFEVILAKHTNNHIIINIDDLSDFSSLGIELFAHENSVTEVIIICNGSSKSSKFIKGIVEQNATLNIYYINSAKDDLNDLSVSLVGENSSSKVKTVAIAKEAKKYFSIRIDHYAKHSFGRIVNHGVGLENCHLIIDGFGKIHKNCKHSDNYQKSKILSLHESSCVEANPILLIDEYDVVASHAASVSNVDNNQLYYLMSRGITKTNAQVLLIKGFLKTIVNEISNDDISEKFESILDKTIGYEN